ncbi:MAG: hypothetical protein EAZ69_29480 [Oscillatoriales cyanobacterium]|nr:MAG: hypothetical protein EAZ69_29480 [Oscillatoriales cyanobacterium]
MRVETFVSQQDILNLAKEGDARAIAFLIGQALQTFGVTGSRKIARRRSLSPSRSQRIAAAATK